MAGQKFPREMSGAELKSMLKSSINFKSLGGLKCKELNARPEQMQWWRDAKVGMFVHWGLYSILGRGEWVRHNEQIPWPEYTALAGAFQAIDFDMHEWTDVARELGANYMVMVSRHHDGFALWNSPGSYGHFNSFETGAHRDFVREYTDACREAGLRVGLYYSPMDWRFPGYFDPKGEKDSRNAANALLMKKQCYDQVEELMKNYGLVDILWYDGGWLAHEGSDTSSAWFWEPLKLNRMVKNHQPDVIVNPRSGWEGNFYCDEGSHEITGGIIPVPWEKNMCLCSGCSWGWMADDPVSDFNWLVQMIVNVVTRDGNILLNVGPDWNGHIRPEVRARIREIGAWLAANGESLYGTRGGPFEPQDYVYGAAYRGNTVYLHILDTDKFRGTKLPGREEKLLCCRLADGTEIDFLQERDSISLSLPQRIPAVPDTIVCMEFDRDIAFAGAEEIHFTGK